MYRLALLILFLATPLITAQTPRVTLRVMTFNIWYGGEQVNFEKVVEAIRSANPDIAGIQEPDGNLRMLAQRLGYPYFDETRYLLSKYPLFEPSPGRREFVWAMVAPGSIVAVANVHLTSDPYGPEAVRDGKTLAEVLQLENRVRVPEIQQYAKALSALPQQGIPVILTGDFNTPSHLDWTTATPGAPFPVDWPVTRLLANAGFRDSFREVHPDPIKKPGRTWTPGHPHPWVRSSATLDRIDMIWIGGPIVATESQIVGEADNSEVDIPIAPYPSDHRGVVSTLRITPAPAPALVAVERSIITQGDDFLVRFHIPKNADWGLAIVRRGDGIDQPLIAAPGPNEMSTRPTIKLSSAALQPGAYDAVLTDGAAKALTRAGFHVIAKSAAPELRAEKQIYKTGEAVRVAWRNAPGMKNDWIAIYKADDPDIYGGYIVYKYTAAAVEGSIVFDQVSLPEGDYELRLLRDDSYVLLASTRFRVTK